MTRTLVAIAALLAACGFAQPLRPNIVVLMADDLGFGDVGFHGGMPTPAIDALAAQSIELARFYVQPVCSPTRAALLTGRYPMRYGMQQGATHLPLGERTLAEALRKVGYRTAVVGKWHLGWRHPAYRPTQRGFDHQYGLYTGATDYFERTFAGSSDPNWFRDDEPLREEGYATDLIAAEAVRLIAAHDPEERLFLWVSFNAPHTPLAAAERHRDRYPELAPIPRLYAQVVAALDEGVASVMAALEARGMRDDTLVLFFSDNGPSSNAPGSAGTLRGHKHLLYEGGVRVPALVSWPGVLEGGSVYEPPVHVVDLYPTLLSLAGASPEPDRRIDGVDVWLSLAHAEPPPRYEMLYNADVAGGRASGILRGSWKLILRGERAELFDLATDPGEEHNLAKQRPDLRRELEARIDDYRREAVPAMPGGRPHLPQIDAELRERWSEGDIAP